MRAIRVHEFGDPDVLRLEELAEPRPIDDEVLVRVQAAGVNPVDTYVRAGAYGSCRPFPTHPAPTPPECCRTAAPASTWPAR